MPAGASTSSPSSVNVARPRMTTYISSCWYVPSVCSSTISSPTSAVYALVPKALMPKRLRTGRHFRPRSPTGISSSSSMWTMFIR